MFSVRSSPLLLLVAVYLGLRALLLLTSFDQHALPVYELSPAGILAQVASSGWRGPPLSAYYDNCGGHLVVGLLAAPVYQVLGPSYLALKLVPLALGLLDLLLVWDIARRLFGRRAALVAGLAFALGPQTLLVYSVLAKGNHFEGLTLQWLATWLWVRGHRSPHSGRWWLAASLTAGLAISVYFGAVLWIALLAVTHWVVRGPRRGAAELAGAALPLGLGLLPVLWIELETGRPGNLLQTYVQDFQPLERLASLFVEVLPSAAGFSGPAWSLPRLASGLWILAFAVAWVLVLLRIRSGSEAAGTADGRFERLAALPFLAYLPLFCIAFAVTTPRFDLYPGPVQVGQFRYLVPFFAFSSVLFGIVAASAAPLRRPLAAAAVALPLLLSGLFALARVDWSFRHLGEGSEYPGYDYADVARMLLREPIYHGHAGRIEWDRQRIAAELSEFEAQEQARIAFGLGREMARAQALETRVKPVGTVEIGRILAWLPESLRAEAARGVGAALVQVPAHLSALEETLGELARIHPESAAWVVEGLTSPPGGALTITTPRALFRSRALEPSIPPGLRDAWVRGQGLFCGQLLARGLKNDTENVRVFLGRLPDDELELFWASAETGWSRSNRRSGAVFAVAREEVELALQAALDANARLEAP